MSRCNTRVCFSSKNKKTNYHVTVLDVLLYRHGGRIVLKLGELLVGRNVGLRLTDQAVKEHGPSLAARP